MKMNISQTKAKELGDMIKLFGIICVSQAQNT